MKRSRLQVFIFVLAGLGVLGFVGLLVLRLLVVHTWHAPGAAMYPTINSGDVVAGLQWPYRSAEAAARATQRGDVVIFAHPEQRADFLQRVVGLPGDTIEVLVLGDVRVNGMPLRRCELGAWPEDASQQIDSLTAFVETQGERQYIILHGRRTPLQTQQLVVPPGHVFVMGDNRDSSWDSRHWGTVPFENIRARVTHIVFSSADPEVWHRNRLGHEVHAGPLVPSSMDEALKHCQK